MPKGAVVEESEYRFEEGWQPARLESVVENTNEFIYKESSKYARDNGLVGKKGSITSWRWNFKLAGSPYNGDDIRGETPAKVSTREDNKARLWYEALIGHELEVGEGVDTDLVEGLACQVLIRHQDPVNKKDGTKGYYCEVVDVTPASADQETSSYSDEPPF